MSSLREREVEFLDLDLLAFSLLQQVIASPDAERHHGEGRMFIAR